MGGNSVRVRVRVCVIPRVELAAVEAAAVAWKVVAVGRVVADIRWAIRVQ